MQVILQGSLGHFPPAELLAFLCGRGRAGTLDLESAGKRTRVCFDDARIVWAESSKDRSVEETVLEAFEWTDGKFTLLDAAVLPDGAERVSLELAPLIEEGKRRAEEASIYGDSTVFRVVENPAKEQISLNTDQLRLLFKLTSGRSLRDLIADTGSSRRDMVTRLRELEVAGLMTATRGDEPAKPSPLKTQAAPKTQAPKTQGPPPQPPSPPAPQEDPGEKTRVESTPFFAEPAAQPVAPPPAAPEPPPAPRKPTLVGSLTPDTAPDNVYPLLDNEHSIGRANSNTITINDPSVSTNHARIVRTADGFVLEDLKSRNGTFVNGEKVAEKRLLVDGDLVRLGKVIMTFNIARDADSRETTQREMRIG